MGCCCCRRKDAGAPGTAAELGADPDATHIGGSSNHGGADGPAGGGDGAAATVGGHDERSDADAAVAVAAFSKDVDSLKHSHHTADAFEAKARAEQESLREAETAEAIALHDAAAGLSRLKGTIRAVEAMEVRAAEEHEKLLRLQQAAGGPVQSHVGSAGGAGECSGAVSQAVGTPVGVTVRLDTSFGHSDTEVGRSEEEAVDLGEHDSTGSDTHSSGAGDGGGDALPRMSPTRLSIDLADIGVELTPNDGVASSEVAEHRDTTSGDGGGPRPVDTSGR